MAAPATASEFIGILEQSGLMSSVQVTRLRAQVRGGTSQALAQALLNQGLLTEFQARMLLLGRFRGLQLGPYRLLDELGAGGMGVVYLAEHQDMRRQVALKVLAPEKAEDQGTLERFVREARAAATLQHPNLVRAYDVHHDKGLHYLVLEYVDGVNVSQLLKRVGRIPLGFAAHFIRQAALGLAYAHEQGLIHRDIKPGNLMVTEQGQVKLLDMGLARFSDHTADELTRNFDGSAVLGTADYISPEQALDSHEVDYRTDLYSLGATLFALVAGRPPFSEGTLAQKLMMHQMKPAPRLDEMRENVPPELVELTARLLEKNPDDRPASAAEVADILEPWAKVPPADWLPSLGLREHPSQTKPMPSLTVRERRPQTPDPLMPSVSGTRLRAEQKRATAAAPKRGRRNWRDLYIVGGVVGALLLIGLAWLCWPSGEASTVVASGRRSLGVGITLESPALAMQFLGDSDRLLVGCEDGHVREYQSGRPTEIRKQVYANVPIVALAANPSGSCLAVALENGKVTVMDYRKNARRAALQNHSPAATAVAVTPNGDWVFTAGSDGQIRGYKLEGSKPKPTWVFPFVGTVHAMHYLPGSKGLVVGGKAKSRTGEWLTLNAESGEVRQRQEDLPAAIRRLAFAGDKRKQAALDDFGKLLVTDGDSPPQPLKLSMPAAAKLVGLGFVSGQELLLAQEAPHQLFSWPLPGSAPGKVWELQHKPLLLALSVEAGQAAVVTADQQLHFFAVGGK